MIFLINRLNIVFLPKKINLLKRFFYEKSVDLMEFNQRENI